MTSVWKQFTLSTFNYPLQKTIAYNRDWEPLKIPMNSRTTKNTKHAVTSSILKFLETALGRDSHRISPSFRRYFLVKWNSLVDWANPSSSQPCLPTAEPVETRRGTANENESSLFHPIFTPPVTQPRSNEARHEGSSQVDTPVPHTLGSSRCLVAVFSPCPWGVARRGRQLGDRVLARLARLKVFDARRARVVAISFAHLLRVEFLADRMLWNKLDYFMRNLIFFVYM